MHIFETTRLRMRPLQPVDEALYCACYTNPVLMQHIGEPLGRETALRSFKTALNANSIPPRQHTWVMQDTQSCSAIGLLGLVYDANNPEPINAQIGAIIFEQFQNRGFAEEAINALVNVAFSLSDIAVLYTRHTMHHGAAQGLMEKLGFQHEIRGLEETFCNYWLLHKADWQKRTQDPIPP